LFSRRIPFTGFLFICDLNVLLVVPASPSLHFKTNHSRVMKAFDYEEDLQDEIEGRRKDVEDNAAAIFQ